MIMAFIQEHPPAHSRTGGCSCIDYFTFRLVGGFIDYIVDRIAPLNSDSHSLTEPVILMGDPSVVEPGL